MRTVIFRPTNDCNLACTYCYDKNNHNTDTSMLRKNATKRLLENEEELLKAFEKLYEKETNPQVIFHGGEPLLIDPIILDRFCSKLKEIKPMNFSIQTNGTLINDQVISLLKKYDFRVGISLDGCNEQQNCARIFPNRINSFNVVFKNIKKLQENGVKHGIIMSISKSQSHGERKIYDFIGENNINCNIRPVFAADSETSNTIMTPEEYSEFFNNLFDIWISDKDKKVSTHQILELYNALKQELDGNFINKICSASPNCFMNFISLDVNGELYACNRLYGKEPFHYGNIKNLTMPMIEGKAKELLIKRNASIQEKCSSCASLKKCNGGCPAESYDVYGDILHPSAECKIKQLVSKHIREVI